MKFFNSYLVPFFVVFLILQSCSKDRIAEEVIKEEEVTEEVVFTAANTESLLEELKKDSTLSPITDDGELPFVGPEGTKMWVYPSNLLDQNDNPVSYPYQIEILELYSPKDMILYNVPTVSNGELLVSGGEFRIRAWKDGKQLKANPNENLLIEVPASSPDPEMDLFFGTESGGDVTWTETQPEFIVVVDSLDSLVQESQTNFVSIQNESYGVNVNELGWINCDYFYSSTDRTTISLVSGDTLVPLDYAMKYLYFPEINSMMSFWGNESPQIAVDVQANIVCIAADTSGVPYFYLSDLITIGADTEVSVEMKKSSADDIELSLDGLGL